MFIDPQIISLISNIFTIFGTITIAWLAYKTKQIEKNTNHLAQELVKTEKILSKQEGVELGHAQAAGVTPSMVPIAPAVAPGKVIIEAEGAVVKPGSKAR